MKRRLMRAAVVLLLLTITMLLPLLVASHRIDEAHRDLIREGMTLAEVESIFGVPSGTYDWSIVDDDYRLNYAIYRAQFYLSDTHVVDRRGDKLNMPLSTARYIHKSRLRKTDHSECWTSRHGSVKVGFDDADLVTWIGGWHKTRVEPPWNNWWKKCFGE